MKVERPHEVSEIRIAEIKVGPRIRPVSESAVQAIQQSVLDIGQITSPIHVRKVKGGYELIDGAHRLEVATRLQHVTIEARVWSCTADEARLMEGDANLATAHLAPLELAVSLAERKRAYLKLHPETAKGFAGAKSRWDATETNSFASWMAALFGVTDRQIRNIVSVGEALQPEEVHQLRAAPNALRMNDLMHIGKIGEPDERAEVVAILAAGQAKKAAAAHAAAKARKGLAPPPKSPVEQALKTLREAWLRAPKEAKRRFVKAEFDALEDLVLEARAESDGDDA